jgi:hypothetical protein
MARALQKARFRLCYWPRWVLQVPFAAILVPASRRRVLGNYRGINICSGSFSSFSRIPGSEFLQRTLEALELVERFDARRFRRIQQEVQFIVHAELRSGADYRRPGRFCVVDFTRFDFAKDHDWYLRCYAAALVHEATHGALYSRYVGYTRRNRLRIERLCHSEELRFLKRLDTPDRYWSVQIAGVFNEQYYSQYYGANWFSRLRTIRQRISDVRRDA